MSSYYYPSPSQRAYSHSYAYPTQSPQIVYSSSSHSSRHYPAGYSQPGTYHQAPQYAARNYQYDTGRHHHSGHARSGSGGPVYYSSSAPTHHHHRDSSRHSPSHHATSHRSASKHTHSHRSRSQSVPRQVRIVGTTSTSGNRLRRSESRPRDTSTHNVSHHHRRSSSNEHFTDRIRRMFGFGDGSTHRERHADYVDARTGHTVDWRGRPIYRV